MLKELSRVIGCDKFWFVRNTLCSTYDDYEMNTAFIEYKNSHETLEGLFGIHEELQPPFSLLMSEFSEYELAIKDKRNNKRFICLDVVVVIFFLNGESLFTDF